MKKYSDLVKLTNAELLEKFVYRVQFDHYDPSGMKDPEYTYEELEDELRERMSRYEV